MRLGAQLSGIVVALLTMPLSIQANPGQDSLKLNPNNYQMFVGSDLFNCNDTTGQKCDSNSAIVPNASEIITVIKTVANATESKRISIVTGGLANPYSTADFYQTKFAEVTAEHGIKSDWLAVTPALLKAVETGQCNALSQYRSDDINPSLISSKIIEAEQQLCQQGISGIQSKIKNTGVIVFVGGVPTYPQETERTSDRVLPLWLEEVSTVPMLVSIGVPNAHNRITDSRVSVERTKSTAWQQPQFRYGPVINYFSEQNRTLDLYAQLIGSELPIGFGVDETTALLVVNSEFGQTADVAVLGKSGVVTIEPIVVETEKSDSFYYSYWPSGAKARLVVDQGAINVSHQQAVKEKFRLSLPTELPPRLEDILTNSKLRSLTQVMCMTNKTSSEGIQRDGLAIWQLSFEKTPETRFTLYSVENNRCAIERLKITVNKLKLRFD